MHDNEYPCNIFSYYTGEFEVIPERTWELIEGMVWNYCPNMIVVFESKNIIYLLPVYLALSIITIYSNK